jgi:hypothetical protein
MRAGVCVRRAQENLLNWAALRFVVVRACWSVSVGSNLAAEYRQQVRDLPVVENPSTVALPIPGLRNGRRLRCS